MPCHHSEFMGVPVDLWDAVRMMGMLTILLQSYPTPSWTCPVSFHRFSLSCIPLSTRSCTVTLSSHCIVPRRLGTSISFHFISSASNTSVVLSVWLCNRRTNDASPVPNAVPVFLRNGSLSRSIYDLRKPTTSFSVDSSR